MARKLLWRLARTLLAMWTLASAVFLLSRHDMATAVQLAQVENAEAPIGAQLHTPAALAAAETAVRHRLGLDIPLFYVGRDAAHRPGTAQWHWNGWQNQYHRWATLLAHGQLGTSFRTGETVTTRLWRALLFTLPLTGTAAILATLAALVLAQRLAAGPAWRRPLQTLLVTLHALPLFVVALVLLLVFANPEVLAWFPAYGLDQSGDTDGGFWSQAVGYVWHLALPVTVLALTALPELTLQLEASVSQELRSQYATTARAKGLAEAAVIRHHALRNALLPVLTMVAELLPALVAGAVVVEVVFALPGMGRLLAEAAAARDYPVLVGGVLLTGAARLLSLQLVEVLYRWADPRIRWQS